ncbi:MAG: efflux RND transporter periplasmic adaptor subunit [Helicobacteraceae bacterium]|nr:efflux RND transporter periplasmic adaptor subunit [Helicobacteraceae bacterium]
MRKIFYIFLFLCVSLYGEDVYATFISQGVKEATLKLNSSGTVDSIMVDIGSRVKKGDILLKIQNNTQMQNVNIQKAQLDATDQTYQFQKNQFERYEQSRNAIDRNTYEQIYFNFKKTESDLKVAQATLKYQEELLANTYLKAPFDGVIASKTIELGDGVAENNTELFKLISNDIKLVLEFDSKYAGKVKVGDTYTFSIDGSNNKRSVKITKVYPSIDTQSRRLKAEALVNNMMSGIFGDGYIRTK